MTQNIVDARTLLAQSPTPVTVFTLSWCSYCHAAKRLLRDLNVPFTVIELDTGDFRPAAIHNRLRQDLYDMTGSQTLPQVFIGEIAVGGYTETQAALRSGQLKTLLAAHQIKLP
jgi:glutaredoxin 3